VTPGAILPAREQLGELLLELKQPSPALEEFKTSLVQAPNRFNGLYAQRVLLARGRSEDGKELLRKTRGAFALRDTTRPEIEEAKAFLTGAKGKKSARTP